MVFNDCKKTTKQQNGETQNHDTETREKEQTHKNKAKQERKAKRAAACAKLVNLAHSRSEEMAEAKIVRQDALFRRVAAEQGNIMTLLDSFFGFLKRNTDFYIVNDDPASTAGFPRGTAERLTLKAFRKHATVDVTPSPVQSADRNKSERAATVAVDVQPPSHSSKCGALQFPGPSAECSSLLTVNSSKPSLQQISEEEPTPTKVYAAEGGVDSGTRSQVVKSGLDILDDLRKTMKTSRRKCSEGGHLQVPLANGGIASTYWWEQNLKGVVLHVPVRFVEMFAQAVTTR